VKALLIQHKGAGGGSTSRRALSRAIEKAGWKLDYLERKHADAEAIRAAEPDLVVVAGGDGTVAKVLAMLPDRSRPVALIPTGSANDIARSLGIAGEPEALVAGWDLDRRRRFDIGNAHGPWGCRPFAEGVGFGAFAASLRRVPDVDGRDKIRAGRDALRATVAEAAPLPLEILVDGERLPSGLLLVEAMNVPLTGPRLPLAPDADAGDGKLHVAFLAASGRGAMLRWLADADEDDADAPVRQLPGREIVVRGGGAAMRIDDESRGLKPESLVTIRLEGEPVQLLAPPEAPALAG